MRHKREDAFPETFLPGVARAADRAMQEILDPEQAILDRYLTEIPMGLNPRRARRT